MRSKLHQGHEVGKATPRSAPESFDVVCEACELDWNTNLDYYVGTEKIWWKFIIIIIIIITVNSLRCGHTCNSCGRKPVL